MGLVEYLAKAEVSVLTLTSALKTASDVAAEALAKTDQTSANLEDRLIHQKDLIAQIENTMFGSYLDDYEKKFKRLQTLGSSTADILEADRIRRALYDPALGIQTIIRTWTGSAGAQFNFETFEQDIREILRYQKQLASQPPQKTLGTAVPASSSCPQGTSLPISYFRGVLG